MGCWVPLMKTKSYAKSLFIRNDETVDANYDVPLLNPSFAEKGSNHRHAEETVFDSFQDFVMATEDTKITDYAKETKETEKSAETQAPDFSPAGIWGWQTGQKHRPLDGQKLRILVKSDHDCLKRNPVHLFVFLL